MIEQQQQQRRPRECDDDEEEEEEDNTKMRTMMGKRVGGGGGRSDDKNDDGSNNGGHHLLLLANKTAAEGTAAAGEGEQRQQQQQTTTTPPPQQQQAVPAGEKQKKKHRSAGSNSRNTKTRRRSNTEEEEGIYLMCKATTKNGGGHGTDNDDGSSSSNKARQFVINFLVVAGVAVSWALAVQFRKSTMVIDPSHFYAPFTLVWFSTGFMAICLPVFLLSVSFGSAKNVRQELCNSLNVLRSPRGHFSIWHSMLCPLFFLCLWTAINYSYAQALGLISAGAASSIMSASTALVCVLGWILLRERFSALKFVAVLVAMVGVVLVAFDHEFSANQLGICLAILSTVIAAFYKVLFKLCVGNASLGQVSLFMTILGMQNLLLNTGLSVVLLHLGWDHIEWAHVPWSPLIGSALLGLIFNFLVNFGIALLDPLVISVGMLFGMPLSASIDVLFRAMPISALFMIGSLLITFSFVLIAFPVELALRNCHCFCSTK